MTNAKILIVLDDDADAARLEKRLTDLGYAVCATLSCGQQAIENIAVLHPDLALIDLALAGSVHGIEVAQQLGRQIPVIYLTDGADANLLQRAQATQPFGYVLKSIDERQLHLNIQTALSLHEREREQLEIRNGLEQTTQLMETVFNSMDDGIVVADTKGHIVLANPSMKHIFDMETADVEPDDWSKTYGVFHLDQKTYVPTEQLPLVRTMMSGEETVPEEFFIRSDYNKTGAYIRVWARPLRSHDKQQVIGSVGFIRDVTKPKAVEDKLQQTLQELREQTQLMETIFNSISDGVIAADTNGRVLLINPIMQQMLGDIVDSDPREWAETYGVFLPDKETYASAEQIPLVSAMQGGTTDQIELFIRNQANAAGRYLSVSGRPLRENDGGELRGGVCVVRDITKSKMAEEELEQTMNELRNQSELMETTFNSISDGIVVADAAGNFLYVNSSAEQIVGMGATDEPQAEWAEKYGTFYPDQETPMPTEDLPLIRAIFKGESTDDEDIFIRNEHRPDGVYIRVSGRPLRNEIGGIRGGVITFRDVSEQMSAEEALMQAFAQGRLEIVDTILHNIGNAINSVTIGIEMVHQNLADDSLVRRIAVLADAIETHREDWVDYIQNDPQGQKVLPFVIALAEDFRQQRAERINTMDRVKDRADHIADIVRTQKVLSNPNIVRKDINLKGAISAAARVLQDSLGKRGIELTVDCENAPQEIRIQESQFHQMLVNLIKNSIEALDDLAAAGGLAQAPRIQIRAYSAEDFLHLDISDNGIGIDMKDAKRIFAAGYTTKNSGSGLGLHSAANFVIGSGGQIQPSSDGLGQGTTMSIMLRHSAITPV